MESGFVPGGYWTRERASTAVDAMTAELQSPEMQAMMLAIAAASHDGQDPAAASAALSGVQAARSEAPITRDGLVFRRGRSGDEAGLARLIVEGHLPPFFINAFLGSFLVVEHAGEIVACGAAEMYADTSVIRSVVVSERGRGLGLGREVALLLEEDARASGATDLYLFTIDAWKFWEHMGYVDTPTDQWRAPAQQNWQYQFIVRFPEAVQDVHAMWKRA